MPRTTSTGGLFQLPELPGHVQGTGTALGPAGAGAGGVMRMRGRRPSFYPPGSSWGTPEAGMPVVFPTMRLLDQ